MIFAQKETLYCCFFVVDQRHHDFTVLGILTGLTEIALPDHILFRTFRVLRVRFVAVGLSGLVESSRLWRDWTKIRLSLRSLRVSIAFRGWALKLVIVDKMR